jgi:chemotaxis regulatin CheY-phosphate phosphatase CheZ
MTGSKSKGAKRRAKDSAVTEVRCADDLHAAMAELVSTESNDAIHNLEGILDSLKREFNPASVTMTSTNIPDAVTKLSSVLLETSQAAARVFQLVERQKSLVEENERCLAAIERLVRENPIDSGAIVREVAKSRETNVALRQVSHEIVMTQEFQDLSSQKVQKVIRLIGGLDSSLRALLTHFKIATSLEGSVENSAENADIDQGGADDILKGFGI